MAKGDPTSQGIDVSNPSIARAYDFFLGGKDNFAADREMAALACQVTPDGPEAAQANRSFLRRVVRYLVEEAGIRQFLDIGSGLPTQGNVHEVAHEIDPKAQVVYVDNDPIVLAHGRALLADNQTTTVVTADLRRPDEILRHERVREFIDFDRPVGLLLFAILHHVHDVDDPPSIAASLRAALPPGSYLAVSHFHNPGDALPDVAREAAQIETVFNETLGTGRWRSRDEILAYFGDMELLVPGLVPLPQWRPDADERSEQSHTYHTFIGGVGRKA